MTIKRLTLAILCTIIVLQMQSFSWAAQEITLWHALGGPIEGKLKEFADRFNKTQSDYQITPINKSDSYTSCFEEGIEKGKAGKPPHILQVFEVATTEALEHLDLFVSLSDVMRHLDHPFNPSEYIPAVRDFYTLSDGKMLSLPLNASTGILFYNKEAFKKAGLDPDKPPQTWEEMEKVCSVLVRSGAVKYGFSTAWPAAYTFKQFGAWHGEPFATHGNGFESTRAELVINAPLYIRHVENLVRWQEAKLYKYEGRFNDSEDLFKKGECGIFLQGANREFSLKNAPFEVGVGYLPFYSDVKTAPQNTIIGGSSLWVMAGHSEEEYKVIAAFLDFLSRSDIQAEWHQATSYLPITKAAFTMTEESGFYETHPAAYIAVRSVLDRSPKPHTKGIRLTNFIKVRERILDKLEEALSGKKSVKQALDEAVFEGNQMMWQR